MLVHAHEPIKLLTHADEPIPLIMPTRNGAGHSSSNGNGAGHRIGDETPFEMWKSTNVVKQKQPGYVTAAIKLFMGDLTCEQMLCVADLAERYANGNIRTFEKTRDGLRVAVELEPRGSLFVVFRKPLGDTPAVTAISQGDKTLVKLEEPAAMAPDPADAGKNLISWMKRLMFRAFLKPR